MRTLSANPSLFNHMTVLCSATFNQLHACSVSRRIAEPMTSNLPGPAYRVTQMRLFWHSEFDFGIVQFSRQGRQRGNREKLD